MEESRSLAHIEIIKDITPIKGADRIEVAHVLGWECEGIVVRCIEGGEKLLSFKVINPKFLLKYE